MSPCSEAEYRASLTDAEFWEHVFHSDDGDDDGPDDYGPADDDVQDESGVIWPRRSRVYLYPCPVCGTWYGVCGYDAEGLPMVHVTEDVEASSQLYVMLIMGWRGVA